MAAIKGFAGQQKLGPQNYSTVNPVGSNKYSLDVAPKALFPITGTSEPIVSATYDSNYSEGNFTVSKGRMVLEITGHNARIGDVLRFDSGPLTSVEATVIGIVDANKVSISTTVGVANALASTALIMRHVTLTLDSSGSLVVTSTSGPITFVYDGVDTQVEKDTVTPANTRALPVEIVSTNGVEANFNVTTGDLNIDSTHLGANFDSMRIGDGTNLMGVNASNEALVHDAEALTELQSIVTNTTGLATEAKQDTIISELQTNNSGLDVVDQIDTTPLLDTSVTNIPASASLPLEIVASTAADVKKIISVEDIGEYIGIYTGAAASEVLKAVLPLGGGELELNIASGTRVSLRAMENTAISTGKIAINFLG